VVTVRGIHEDLHGRITGRSFDPSNGEFKIWHDSTWATCLCSNLHNFKSSMNWGDPVPSPHRNYILTWGSLYNNTHSGDRLILPLMSIRESIHLRNSPISSSGFNARIG